VTIRPIAQLTLVPARAWSENHMLPSAPGAGALGDPPVVNRSARTHPTDSGIGCRTSEEKENQMLPSRPAASL
jgi:hypothetical protein